MKGEKEKREKALREFIRIAEKELPKLRDSEFKNSMRKLTDSLKKERSAT